MPLNWMTSLRGIEISLKSSLQVTWKDFFFFKQNTWLLAILNRTATTFPPSSLPHLSPSPKRELKKLVWFYLQLWSSWLWESRSSWPSSPVLKSSGAGQRNTGIVSASHKSPLCTPVAPRSWARCSGGVCTVPEASEIKEVREKHSH